MLAKRLTTRETAPNGGQRRGRLMCAGRGEDYGKALGLARNFGMRPTIAHCHSGVSKLHRRRVDRRGSGGPDHCVGGYREMDMTYWLEHAEAEMGQPL